MRFSATYLNILNGLLCLLIAGCGRTAASSPRCLSLSGTVAVRGAPPGGGPGLLLDYAGTSLILLAPAPWDTHKELLRLEVQKAAAEAARVGVFEAPPDIAAWGGIALSGEEYWSQEGDQGLRCCTQGGTVACEQASPRHRLPSPLRPATPTAPGWPTPGPSVSPRFSPTLRWEPLWPSTPTPRTSTGK